MFDYPLFMPFSEYRTLVQLKILLYIQKRVWSIILCMIHHTDKE